MRASTFWTARARRDFHGIISYIKDRSPQAAARLAVVIFQRVKRLEKFPESGRKIPEDPDSNPPLRELIITDYRLVYSFRGRRVEIIALFHGRRPLGRGLLH